MNFVGEIGINHNGSVENAKKIIDSFPFLDVFKLQRTTPKIWMGDNYFKPHPVPANAFAETYGKHREFLELSMEDSSKLIDYVRAQEKRIGISVFDLQAAKEAIELDPDYIKIPSCRCNALDLIKFVKENYTGFLHISSGMTTLQERLQIPVADVIYSCTSGYQSGGRIFIEHERSGFSCHQPDIFYGQAAILGSSKLKWIEYHITTDREQKGTDHQISLLPDEYRALVDWYEVMQYKIDRLRFMKPVELPEEEALARSKMWSTVLI